MMRQTRIFTILAYALIVATAVVAEDGLTDGLPQKKLISTFQIVRFPNDACKGTNSKNGTCYTSAECSDKGGASSGSCADGFGVCCTFIINACGKSSAENITYWTQPSTVTTGASCNLNLCPVNTNICQLRIDFSTFVITGPSTSTLSEGFLQGGMVPQTGAANSGAIMWTTNCLVDSFSVSAQSVSNSPPVICGTNTGYHMYVDANVEECNLMEFNIGDGGFTVTTTDSDFRGVTARVTPKWELAIYQYECGDINSAPPGCTQYFYGAGAITGIIHSYNYAAGTVHLSNQNQKICIRRERNYCWACFATPGTVATFSIGGVQGAANAFTAPGQPCGYNCNNANYLGDASDACSSYDCVIIPDAFFVGAPGVGGVVINTATTAANIRLNTIAAAHVGAPPMITGHTVMGIGAANNAAQNAVTYAGGTAANSFCTKHVPFQLTFKSDGFEGTGVNGERGTSIISQDQKGFAINYEQIKCTA